MKKRLLFFSFIGSFLLICDFFSKDWIYHHLSPSKALPFYPYGGIGVFQKWFGVDFSIVHVCNKGIAWGMFSSMQGFLPYFRIVLIGVLVYFLFSPRFIRNFWSLGLMLIGAIGNVIDHFIYGYVLDMFYFRLWGYSYPVFNIADSLIFLGVVSFFFVSSFTKNYDVSKSTSN